jgi:hypothetical protein
MTVKSVFLNPILLVLIPGIRMTVKSVFLNPILLVLFAGVLLAGVAAIRDESDAQARRREHIAQLAAEHRAHCHAGSDCRLAQGF